MAGKGQVKQTKVKANACIEKVIKGKRQYSKAK
jgi:hypothetical protein